MKRFAWLAMFLALGLFAYTGCGGPPAGPTSSTAEEDDIAEQDMATFDDAAMGAPDDDAGDADADADAGVNAEGDADAIEETEVDQ